MKPKNAKETFSKFLAERRGNPRRIAPADGVAAMLDFYEHVRADGCELDEDGDMLLYQWGTSGRGEARQFELDITRQFILGGGEDDAIWQLHLTFRYEASDALAALGSGDRWCSTPDELGEMRTFLHDHPAYKAACKAEPRSFEVRFECAG